MCSKFDGNSFCSSVCALIKRNWSPKPWIRPAITTAMIPEA